LERVRTGRDAAAELELTIEPIPKTLANQGLSRQLGHRWKGISKRERAKHNHRCVVCGVSPEKGRLHLHETWEYGDAARVQKLSGLVALCDLCHRVKHGVWIKHIATWPLKKVDLAADLERWQRWREWSAIKYQEELRLPENEREPGMLEVYAKQASTVMPCEHFLQVNGCDIETAERHIRKVAKTWRRRSRQKRWRVDYGEYAGLLPNAPRTPA
jgi:hypothetical protein